MAPGKIVRLEDLPPELRASEITTDAAREWENSLRNVARACLDRGESQIMKDLSARFERVLIEAALNHTSGRKQDAALRLGLGRNTLTRKLKELGLPDTP
jgi:two-component system nitrogen regulation response regulator GlnG